MSSGPRVYEITEPPALEKILRSPPAIVIFYNPDCSVCKKLLGMIPVLVPQKIPVYLVNTKKQRELAMKHNILGTPTTYIVDDTVERIEGLDIPTLMLKISLLAKKLQG
jgi:thioredoxin-like negative regulator of GroEL